VVLLLLVFQVEVLSPRILPAAAHLDALLVHTPDMLGWDPTREPSMKMFHLVEVIFDHSFIEILRAFGVELRSLRRSELWKLLKESCMPIYPWLSASHPSRFSSQIFD